MFASAASTANDGWSVISRQKRPLFYNSSMGLKASSNTREMPLKTASTTTTACYDALAPASYDAYPSLTPTQPPEKKARTTWSNSFAQTVLKMAANEATELAAKEQAERDRRYEADLRDYIRSTIPTRSEFIEPNDDYSSGYSEEETDDITPSIEEEYDEKPLDYRHYGSRRTFADA